MSTQRLFKIWLPEQHTAGQGHRAGPGAEGIRLLLQTRPGSQHARRLQTAHKELQANHQEIELLSCSMTYAPSFCPVIVALFWIQTRVGKQDA